MADKDAPLFCNDNQAKPLFNDAEPKKSVAPEKTHYKLLIVDDEQQVHDVTKLVLSDFIYKGRSLEFLHAYSASDAKELIRAHDDIAVILLDVVMETSMAGLEVAQWIRNEQHDRKVRIILRTGQPGEAPEEEIMVRYDINDYKEKTELTAQKTKTLMHSCLRSYEDITTINRSCNMLKGLVYASQLLFKTNDRAEFDASIQPLLQQLMLYCDNDSAILSSSLANENYNVLYATGTFEPEVGHSLKALCDFSPFDQLIEAGVNGYLIHDYSYYGYVTCHKHQYLLYIDSLLHKDAIDLSLIQIFMQHISIGFENSKWAKENI